MTVDRARLAVVASSIGGVALAFAHRDVLIGGGVVPARGGASRWLFAADESTLLPVFALVAWMLWRRRAAMRTAAGRPSPALASLLLAPALVLFAWAQHVASPALLIPCMSLELLGFAAVFRGAAGCRAVALPALVLLLAMPVPTPLYNDLVWWMQKTTTTGSSAILGSLGSFGLGDLDVRHADAMIRVGDRALVVVEACSGLRGVQLLLIASLAIREVFAFAGARAWVVVAIAAPLAMAMNAVRVALIALTDDPQVRVQIASGHLSQGIGVITLGTVLLYAVGLGLAGPPARTGAGVRDRLATGVAPVAGLGSARWPLVAFAFALAAISILPLRSSVPPAADPLAFVAPELPLQRAGWTGQAFDADWMAFGELPLDPILVRRYVRVDERGRRDVVDVMIAWGDPTRRPAYPFSPKLLLPGPEWALEEQGTARIWPLDLEADLVRAQSGEAQAIAYHWQLGDPGAWRAALRAVVGLDPTPRDDARRPVVVRLTAPLQTTGPVASARAKRSLDRFIADYRAELAAL